MAWELTGNTGTDPVSNFLGTTDNEPLIIRTNGAEHLRIAPDGNVGIGTVGPLTTRLEIASDAIATDILRLRNTNPANPRSFRLGPGVGRADNFAIYDDDAAATRLSIDYSGNVGIGTANPGATLDIRANVSANIGPTLRLSNASGNTGAGGAIDIVGYSGASQPVESRIRGLDDGSFGGVLAFYTKTTGASANPLAERMLLVIIGNVRIA